MTNKSTCYAQNAPKPLPTLNNLTYKLWLKDIAEKDSLTQENLLLKTRVQIFEMIVKANEEELQKTSEKFDFVLNINQNQNAILQRQKRLKWIFIITSSALATYTTYNYVKR